MPSPLRQMDASRHWRKLAVKSRGPHAGNDRWNDHLPGPANADLHPVHHQLRALVFHGSSRWKSGFNFRLQVAPGTYQLVAFPVGVRTWPIAPQPPTRLGPGSVF